MLVQRVRDHGLRTVLTAGVAAGLLLAPAWVLAEETAPAAATPTTDAAAPAPDAGQPATTPAPDAAPAADAAAPAEGEAQKSVEEIVVTGTRIGRTNLSEYGHISVLSAEQIAKAGVTTIDQLLLEMPSVTLQGINRNANNGGNGLAFVDLRNLGSNRTLVLVNGRRMVTSQYDSVDLNNIPTAMVERVEVLLDGASAIYGSDAVGGVVNIILKNDFEGLDLDAYTGMSSHGDGAEYTLSATTGANYNKGNVTLNISYSDRQPIKQVDRDWAVPTLGGSWYDLNPDTDASGYRWDLYGSGYTPEGRVGGKWFKTYPWSTGYGGYEIDEANKIVSQGTCPTNGDSPKYGNCSRYDYGEAQYLSGSQQRLGLTALGHYDISDTAQAYFEGLFTHRGSDQQMATQPLGGANATYTEHGFMVPVTNPYIPDELLATLAPGTRTINLEKRPIELGPRLYNTTSDTFRVVTGLKGEILDDYKWDVFFNYGQNRSTQKTENAINLTKAWETLNPEVCRANAGRGCGDAATNDYAGNWFGANSLQPWAIDYVKYTDVEQTGYDHMSTGLSVTGPIVALPAGDLSFAVGGEFRDEWGFNRPSDITVQGDSAGNGQDPTEGGYSVGEAFAELSIPVVSGIPGAQDITVDLAGRYSGYNRDTFGADLTYRAGLSWAPISDVRVRGIYSTAFRAPTMSDLYGGMTDSYETIGDPCNHWDLLDPSDPVNANIRANCQAQGVPAGYDQNSVTGTQIRTNVGGNPDLESETAKVFNAGLVITPSIEYLDKLAVTLDYYTITIDNAISYPDPQNLLDACYSSSGLTHEYCNLIGRAGNGSVNKLEAIAKNIGQVKTSGLDMTANYRLDLDLVGVNNVGSVDIGWQGNYLFNYDEMLEGVPYNYAGTINAGSGTYANWRWNQMLAFNSEDNWSVGSIIRYIGGAKVYGLPASEPWSEVDDIWYWDLEASYKWNDFTVIAGVNNMLDKDPPFMAEGGQNAEAATYDFVGRFGYVHLNYKF